MFGLPNVSSEVYAYGALLYAVVDEVEYFPLGVDFWASCDYYWHWAAVDDFLEVVFAVIGFNYSCADFCGYSAA